MCGLSGFLDTTSGLIRDRRDAILDAMTREIAHRGPDGHGQWLSADGHVGLGHRRLSIIDLSPAGHQPMESRDGRYILVFNGEIFNFRELRSELAGMGHSFNGGSDTEVILAGFVAWGIEAMTKRMIGMFAIAVWDRQRRQLTLIRDRLGIKPLYYGRFGGLCIFASELKSLRRHPGWTPQLDRDALVTYLRYAYVPAPLSIYQGVRKLLPGHMLTLDEHGHQTLTRYWDLHDIAMSGSRQPRRISDREAVAEFEELLGDAVKRRMIADVPLGAFLSGGIDSSAVVALMQAQSSAKVKTFSIGFEEQGYNEAEHAAAVAAHLGTDHTELYVSPEHAREVIPRLPEWFDEPFADSSQIPTFLVSEMTKQHVTVALSGDGGDEILGGYNRYLWATKLWNLVGHIPGPLRRLTADTAMNLPEEFWNKAAALLPARLRPGLPADKARKVAEVLRAQDENAIYRRLVSSWTEPAATAMLGREYQSPLLGYDLNHDFPSFLSRMQYQDLVTYLPDDILTKVDRTSMAVALEVRVPLLDHRVVEYCWTLPKRMKIRRGTTKWLLRQVLYRHVPRSLVERPKMGFGVPVDHWMRGPLKDWAEDLLAPTRLRNQGLFNPEAVQTCWNEHQSGRVNRMSPLWTMLMAQAWLDRWSPSL